MRVLLIEDDEADASAIEELLGTSDQDAFAVNRQGDLRNGLQALEQQRFDAVLLDLNLPDSRGLSTLESVLEATREIPVVVLTGLDDDKLAVEALRQGAADYVSKGFLESGRLERALEVSVERHDLQKEFAAHLAELRDIGVRQSAQVIVDRLRRPLDELRSASEALRRDRRIRLDETGWNRIDAVCEAASRIEALTRNLAELLRLPDEGLEDDGSGSSRTVRSRWVVGSRTD